MGALNTLPLNAVSTPAAGVVEAPYSDVQGRPYRVELHDKNGVLLYILPQVYGAVWRRGLNRPATLSVGHAADDADIRAAFAFPNEMWLYKGDATEPSGKFRILRVSIEEGAGKWLEAEGHDLAEQLGRETVTGFSTPIDEETGEDLGATVGSVLSDLLAFQSFTPKVQLGTVSTSIRNKVFYGRFDGRSIMQCLTDLQEFAGGYWYIDNARRLQWRTSVGNDAGHRIRLGHNAAGIRATLDYSELATRVIARGQGVTADTVLSVTKNDATAQSTYGIITARITDQSIRDAAVLGAVAQAELDRRKQPKVSYDIDTLDLSQTDVFNYSFEAGALEPGTRINLLSDVFDIYTRVETVEVDLDRPLGVRITVGNPEAASGGGGQARVSGQEELPIMIAEIAEAIDDLRNDRGELESVREALDPPPRDLDAIVTWDEEADLGNLPPKLEDALSIPYGDDTAIDDLKTVIAETVREIIENDLDGVGTLIEESGGINLIEASDRAALATAMEDGDLGRTTGTYKHIFAEIDGQERPLMVLRAADLTALNSIAKAGELGTTTGDGALYWYPAENDPRRLLDVPFAENKTALSALLAEGMMGFTTGTTKRFYVKIDSNMVCLSHLE